MVDAHALGVCAFGRVGSNPTSPTRLCSTGCDTRLVTGWGNGAKMRVKGVIHAQLVFGLGASPTGNGRPRDPMVGEKILGAALEILAERGFRGASLRAVAARAGVGTSAIYRRYENREDLMTAAIESSIGVRDVENTGNTEMDLISMLTVVRESVYAGRASGSCRRCCWSRKSTRSCWRRTAAGRCGRGAS